MALLEALLVTLLFGTQASFTHPGILMPTVESTGDTELKNVVKQTQRSREARETLGNSQRVWQVMMETLRAGNEQLSANKHHLLPKVWDLAILARNILAAKEKAQNHAAVEGFEAEIRRLLSICIDKASKPIPPTLDKPSHDKELQMKGGYKKVLITSLQFLNNLMTGNETRKLHLWLHLFGTPSSVNANIGPSAGKSESKNKPKAASTPSLPSSTPLSSSGNCGFVNPAGNTAASHMETAAKCNSLSAGFNAKYYRPGFLTEVPRLLQPDEIEPLLMILQSGVVNFEGADDSMQAVRCKLLLAQGYGRALLREVLVFLGAWEVDEDDFCYRVLGQVVEAILLNGLIPYAYECFRDEKDIVTPAQSVLLKLLVSVYRPQTALPSPVQVDWPEGTLQEGGAPAVFSAHSPTIPRDFRTYGYLNPPVIENSIPTFFINVFRKQVLSPVIKIIQLQGDIRSGIQAKEVFEHSLWDLDRIYEGIYQFLELFVLFSEDEQAKEVLTGSIGGVEHGLVLDLVRLLGELDKAIPRYIASKAGKVSELGKKETKPSENSYMVERPFDIASIEAETPDDEYEEDEDDQDHDRELVEPDEFTWPNIKRFIVILLSSLAWHNKGIQNVVRENGGLHVVINQCKIDDDNPYIREHSILCIRALLQDNKENQMIVEELNARETVPSEVLDKSGYEPYIDERGRVRLKRTDKSGS
ncbi:spinocerebellar ataxia type 10 protein domain-containing protein [Geopyxis carbonaria]|nr:spinocerebellar ataxia type 10 protein domain-containing protein [Geopyxis carbonaria]